MAFIVIIVVVAIVVSIVVVAIVAAASPMTKADRKAPIPKKEIKNRSAT